MWNAAIRPILATGTLALGNAVVLLGQTPPVVTAGATTSLPAVTGSSRGLSPRLIFEPPPPVPLDASGWVNIGSGKTNGTSGPMALTNPEELSPPTTVVKQAKLLEYAWSNILRGLTPLEWPLTQ